MSEWDRAAHGTELWLGAVLIVLLGVWWFARQYYHCDLIAKPFATLYAGLPIFGVVACEVAIIRRFQKAGRDRAAFAALLFLEAVMMFMAGELMTVDHFRKGLEDFLKGRTVVSPTTGLDNLNFVIDYERKEFVLSERMIGDAPFELRRSYADAVCK